ncbi:uncharacterized protein AB675_495 [Cyphellophora attinorum]|uniref:Uncharacterized protein n=1 Tax=Cyphellophora attinorum TaxID=1664694 RepID=A0A0N1P3V4_9EURO|nr:uncharacterized protein AB675_495 [Phialophora attinorum]KPI45873.1 hypothetical protein AB675_495 [Phialophora attinorum]
MVKRAAIPVAAFAAGAAAQSTTTTTYSVCPTASTVTVTLPSTITYCPGASCNVTPTPTITAAPTSIPQGGYISTILDWTFTGSDGKITELHEYATVYPAPCSAGPGMCGATYTITEECPCTAHSSGYIHPDFTTTLHTCDMCGPGGSPTTYTATVPCSTGAYATVTPSMGPWAPSGGKPAGPDAYWAQGGAGGAGGAGGNGGDAEGGAPSKPVDAESAAPSAGWSGSGAAPSGTGKSPVGDYKGAGSKAAVAVSSVFAIVVGVLAITL